MTNPTAKDVAEALRDEFNRQGFLEQAWAVELIHQHFDGNEWTYENEGGGTGIKPSVLREFRKLTPDAVWDRYGFYWEKRHPDEGAGRRRE